jgi:hypothetical protein
MASADERPTKTKQDYIDAIASIAADILLRLMAEGEELPLRTCDRSDRTAPPAETTGREADMSCPGSLVLHVTSTTTAGCTYDDEPEGCAGIELRHEGDPTDCVREWGGCNECGVHQR